MKERAWFSLVMKAIGLWMIGDAALGVGQVAQSMLQMSYFGVQGGPGGGFGGLGMKWWMVSNFGPVAEGILGVYLVFGGKALLDRFCTEVVGRCERCGYERSASALDSCPECGLVFAPRNRPAASDGPKGTPNLAAKD